MALISISQSADGETADASDINTPLNTIATEINGNLEAVNLKDSAVTTAKIADEAVTPAKRSGGFQIGSMAGSTLGTAGNVSVTGVGFIPKLVRFTVLASASGTNQNEGSGAMTDSSQFWTTSASNTSGTAVRAAGTDAAIAWIPATSTTPSFKASYVSMDADGFTINVTTANTSFDIAYEAYA